MTHRGPFQPLTFCDTGQTGASPAESQQDNRVLGAHAFQERPEEPSQFSLTKRRHRGDFIAVFEHLVCRQRENKRLLLDERSERTQTHATRREVPIRYRKTILHHEGYQSLELVCGKAAGSPSSAIPKLNWTRPRATPTSPALHWGQDQAITNQSHPAIQ